MLALVSGTGRCGSTLVQEMLSRHEGVGFISGIDDKLSRLNLSGRFNGPIYRRLPARDPGMGAWRHSRTLLDPRRLRLAPSEGYNLLDRYVTVGFSKPSRDLLSSDMTPHMSALLHNFFDSRTAQQRCDVLLHHVTGWPRSGFLYAAYPDLRVINVVRDGRSVTNSWLQMGWWDGWRGPDNWLLGSLPDPLQAEWEESGRSFVVLAALGWKMLMRAFEEARDRFPAGQWLDVRYEDIVEDNRAHCESMLDFLGLDWSAPFEIGLRRHPMHTSRHEAYREELTADQVAAVEKVLAEPLARWGYSV